jgi:hypothetical protein
LSRAVLGVAVTLDRVEGVRLSEKADANAKSEYKLNVSMSEKKRVPGELTLAFTLDLTCQPQIAKLTVAGSVKLDGPEEEVTEIITPGEDKTPPKVVETIYERTYGLLYVLAGGLKVPYPKPNLLKKRAFSA